MPERGVDEDKRATLRRFAALGAASPLAGLGRAAGGDGDGATDTPDAIVGYVAATPGAHFSKLRDDLKLGTGETQHHLRGLLEAGSLESRRDGDYRRFFPAGRFDEFEQTALGYLRRTTPRGMVLALLRNPDATGADLADRLSVSRATVSAHARELSEAGLLDRSDGYAVDRPETLIALVVRYADSFGPEAVDFADDVDRYIEFVN